MEVHQEPKPGLAAAARDCILFMYVMSHCSATRPRRAGAGGSAAAGDSSPLASGPGLCAHVVCAGRGGPALLAVEFPLGQRQLPASHLVAGAGGVAQWYVLT
jgi:hypothetical protein